MRSAPGRILAVVLAGLAVAASSSGAAAPPTFERLLRVDAPGRVAVRLDREVYEAARADLGDLRVADPAGQDVPYLVDTGRPAASPELRPRVLNRGWRADGAATAVLDFGEPARKSRLALRLSGDNFRRSATVQGSDDGTAWTTLVDGAWVFAVPGEDPARYETLDLPENDFPLLRVVVLAGSDEHRRPAIEGAWVPADGRSAPSEEALSPRWSVARDEPAGETWLTLDLGARLQPFTALVLDVADERFFREVRVEARADAPSPGGRARWEEIARGQVHRLERGGRRQECLRVSASGRARVLRVRVRDGDDRPLDVRGVSVRVPVERLLFDAAGAGEYRLTYGSADRRAPSYDLARTAGDPSAWGEAAVRVALSPPRRLSSAPGPGRPWTERHPALLWGGLTAVVLALGALTARALRRNG